MEKLDFSRFIELVFKVTWIYSALYSSFILTGLTFMSIVTSDWDLNELPVFLNFFLPFIAIHLVIFFYSKELIFGHSEKTKRRMRLEIFSIAILAMAIIISKFNFYQWVLQDNIDITILIPTIVILVSFINLVLHRMIKENNPCLKNH